MPSFFGKNNERKGKSMIVQLIEIYKSVFMGRMDSCSVTRRWKPGTFAAHYIAASSRYRFYDQNKIFTNPSVVPDMVKALQQTIRMEKMKKVVFLLYRP